MKVLGLVNCYSHGFALVNCYFLYPKIEVVLVSREVNLFFLILTNYIYKNINIYNI